MRELQATRPLLALLLVLLAGACTPAGCATSPKKGAEADEETQETAPVVSPVPATRKIITEPPKEMAPRRVHRGGGHKLPEVATEEPEDLPYHEIVNPSRFVPGSMSVGTTSHGTLERQAQLPVEGAHHTILQKCRERHTNYGTEELVAMLLGAAEFVHSKIDGPRTVICNMSKEGGGDLFWSKSHNSGRDTDIAFYALKDGKPVEAPKLLVFDDDLKSTNPKGYTFDVERNWWLVRGLLESEHAQVQWLFVSNPIRKALLAFAREKGEPKEIISRASDALWQPTDSLPHNDHLHLRVYCPKEDMLEGCLNTGRVWSWTDTYPGAMRARSKSLVAGLKDADPEMREQVVDFIGRIDAKPAAHALATLAVHDEKAELRTKAWRTLVRWRPDDPRVLKAVYQAIREPEYPSSRGDNDFLLEAPLPMPTYDKHHQGAEIVQPEAREARTTEEVMLAYEVIAQSASSHSIPFLKKAMKSDRVFKTPYGDIPEGRVAAHATRHIMDPALVPALIDMLAHDSSSVRGAAAESLKRYTNHSFKQRWGRPMSSKARKKGIRKWRQWWRKNAKRSRDALLLAGFKDRSKRVKKLKNLRAMEALIMMTKKDDYLGYNADRVLSTLTGRWSPREARSASDRYSRWTRWWRRNKRRMKRKYG